MQRRLRKLSIFLVCILTLSYTSTLFAHIAVDEEHVYVLLIFSGSYSEPKNEQRLEYIESDLKRELIHYDVFFLDAAYDDTNSEWMSYMETKWVRDYDMIITYDERALEYVLENDSYKDVPVIFTGIMDPDYSKMFDENNLVTGFYNAVDYDGTLSLATKLSNHYQHVYLLTDKTHGSRLSEEQAVQVMNQLDYDYHIINIGDMSMNVYLDKLCQISSEDIVVLISNNMRQDGTLFHQYEIYYILEEYLEAPIYTVDEIGIGQGVLGGSVISYEAEAASIMSAIDEYLKTGSIAEVLVQPIKSIYKLDYNKLVEYNLPVGEVPLNTQLINEPDFYDDRVTVLAIVLLSVFILVLLVAVIGLFYRITNEKKLALAAVKSKSEFLAKMSHEVRTPTNAIIGYTQLLKKSLQKEEESIRKVSLIEESSKSLLNIINDILDYSMIEEGKLSIEPKGTEFLLMFENIANTAEVLIGDKDVKFVLDLDRDIPKYIEIDDKRMEQVFVNLLSNAVKFTKQGEIKLSVQNISQTEHEVKLKWEIQDSGKGMAEDNMDKVFKAFQQEDNSISREYGGTGLGLFITKEIITSMKGRIYVESNIGKGTRFVIMTTHKIVDEAWMYTQREHKHHNMDYSRSQEKLERRNVGKHILIAEDNEVNQMLIQEMLEMMSLEMSIVRNGLEAVAFAREEHCDLILMDIHMPIMNGVDATDRIKTIEAYKDIPVIGLTADVIREHMDEYKKHGFADILTKPVYMEELIRALNKYL